MRGRLSRETDARLWVVVPEPEEPGGCALIRPGSERGWVQREDVDADAVFGEQPGGRLDRADAWQDTDPDDRARLLVAVAERADRAAPGLSRAQLLAMKEATS
ncbi:hypothetical protein GCM10022287_28060 [Gryllotalpicola koreensis]|uniref:Uncharacterized protein n=1 Tax=Gryllotalpicola koreensis TaxID=993086 RepID=A0ABP8A5H1_9MICO